jgi:hypothetical protein
MILHFLPPPIIRTSLSLSPLNLLTNPSKQGKQVPSGTSPSHPIPIHTPFLPPHSPPPHPIPPANSRSSKEDRLFTPLALKVEPRRLQLA